MVHNRIIEAKKLLKEYFGHDSFRSGQEKIISALLDGRDVLGIMPTGAGKSMCYQIPALMATGITIVVSPLISLMNDQVTALVQSGIRGAYYNSSLSEAQCAKVRENMLKGVYKIIYVAPERLETESFKNVCSRLDISYVAIDESHCVSQWGQDFRPSYLKITEFIDSLPKRPVIGAFTATATSHVREDILNILELHDPYVLTTGFDRPNLYFEVRRPKSKKGRVSELLEILDRHKDESGIIYCSTRKAVDELYEILSAMDYPVTRYHAGLDSDERTKNQEDFIFDRMPVVIATNAFGMGIDKSNVAFVVHFNMPKNIENYYQEAGRAGRDGAAAECIMLYMPSDIYTIKFFIEHTENNDELTPAQRLKIKRLDYRRLNRMVDYCSTAACLRNQILNYFGERQKKNCGNCSSCSGMERRINRRHIESIKKHPTKPVLTPAASTRLSPDQSRDLFEKLRLARLKQAKIQGVPPYVIFSDATILDICAKLPTNKQALLAVDGIGAVKAERYGKFIIEEVSNFLNKINNS
ncbi:MAG: RecQ family ATP-dependent DNA helicase [Oscillospiraceae bacterium]|nr:RecQ family ATP-dependent DNA helicase [Oscillospiraceae bacterium]